MSYGLSLGSGGDVYLTGLTASTNFPVTSGVYQATNKSIDTAFISRLSLPATSAGATATPAFSLPAGSYTSAQSVTISDATAGAVIYYTVNGSTPTTNSTVYSAPITVSSTETINAFAVANGKTASPVASATYTIVSAAESIAAVSGSGQSAVVGTAFAAPLVVVVEDANGNAVAGAAVTFTGTDLTFADPTATTGTNGQASTVATPSATGTLTATATTSGVADPATFALTGTPTTSSSGPGTIFTYAGDGTKGFSGDGGHATSAELAYPVGAALDSAGDLYIVDSSNHRIRKISPAGVISTVAGNGTAGFSGDGGAATSAELNSPGGVAVDGEGNLYIGDVGNQRVRKVTTEGVISTFAGTGAYGYNGDGIAATSAQLYYPTGVALDSSGNLYIADEFNNRIRMVDTAGMISTVAGTGSRGYSGDGGPATNAELYFPTGVAVDSSRNLYIADYYNNCVRSVTSAGVIATLAGTGTAGYNGDGIAATNAELLAPAGVAADSAGNVYIGDYGNNRVRKVDTAGMISTVAGNGKSGFSGDGGPAIKAELRVVQSLAVDGSGNLYIADAGNNRVREVEYQTSRPVFSPSAGTYTSAQSVTIADNSVGAAIYYTVDGSQPTTSSIAYTGPITVSSTEMIKAVGVTVGYGTSATASAAYTIALPVAATPMFSIAAGTYTSIQTVTITDTTAGAAIYYTTNGITPTTASTPYTGPITVSSSETLKAIAVAASYTNSAVASADYVIDLPAAATPTFSPAAGTYTYAQTVKITDSTLGATIYYTTNGTTPTASSTMYTGAIPVNTTETINAIAIASGYAGSAVASATFTINTPPPTVATPTFSPVAGTYTSAQSVTIVDSTTGAVIYYTTDGSTPTTSSTRYSAPITVGSTETINAIATANGDTNSAVANATYTIHLPAPAFTLTASPSSATTRSGQSAVFTLTVTPQNGFNQPVSFLCSGTPSGDSCSFSPSTVTPSGAAVSSKMTVSANASATASRLRPWEKASAVLLAALLLWPFRRRKTSYRITIALLLLVSVGTIGCGGTPKPQSYTVAITASGAGASQMTSVSLTITQ
jgi:hypothetical protein